MQKAHALLLSKLEGRLGTGSFSTQYHRTNRPHTLCVGGGGGGRAGGKGQSEVLAGEWEQLFSYVTHCINLIHIALNFEQDISQISQA